MRVLENIIKELDEEYIAEKVEKLHDEARITFI